MNVFQKLAKSAENRHGLELQATQVQELVATLQAMQLQIANDNARMDAQTRILAVALNHAGGAIDIAAELFAEAENYVVDVSWNEEGDEIRASIRMADVEVSEVPAEGDAAAESDSSTVPVSEDDSGGQQDGEGNPNGEDE